ncbi:hypothetical protein D3C81_1974950 [compost metagenome]|uniref:hypothetical protein n=1 Tax=Pseudomonas TaxID=286 RepID=UPI000F903191|nr:MULTISPECIES: hypothetical protein [Pseudomonas]QHF39936.1 hypothetical protein PspS34_17415 [Pseudomonas sp. S34]
MWREFDGFYVLYTAAALKTAKGKEVKRLVVVFTLGCRLSDPRLILADGVAGSQREAGQKEIEMAKIHVRFDQRCEAFHRG